MELSLGRGVVRKYPRRLVAEGADLGDPAVAKAYFDRLAAREIADAAELGSWLGDVSELLAAVAEEESVRYVRMTCRTGDPGLESAFLSYIEHVKPVVEVGQDVLARKFLEHPASGYLGPGRYRVLVRDLRSEVELFREENVALLAEERKLSQRYQKLAGAMTVEYDGEERTLPQMARYLELADRETRKEAWALVAGRRLRDREELDRLFDEMLAVRERIAANAGLADYREYAFRQRRRFDYGVAECETFHRAVEEVVVPLYRERQEARRERLQVPRLRPWDLACDPEGRPPLAPFAAASELADGCREILNRIDRSAAERFGYMIEHELMDLESRKGKAPGAYSISLEEARVPFIFQNAAGLDRDVKTLLHEFGHSLHTFLARGEPLVQYRSAPLEFCEVASMSMEFLGLDHLGVFYGPAEAARSRELRLEEVLWLFCWVAAVDSFQHWIYTHPGRGAEDRARAWSRALDRFMGIEDWDGFEDARRYSWHRQLHIFELPFYYIEYAIAELGALQVWARSRRDPGAALADYRRALALGGSRPLPELFAAAGIKFDFSARALAPLVEMVRAELD